MKIRCRFAIRLFDIIVFLVIGTIAINLWLWGDAIRSSFESMAGL